MGPSTTEARASAKMDVVAAIMAALAEGDRAAFLEHFSDDVEYHYHVGSRPLIGKEWLGRFLENHAAICGDAVWRVDRHAEAEDFLMMEGFEAYTDLRTGERVTHSYMGVVEFEDGKITKWRDYFEMGGSTNDEAAS